MTGFKLSVWAKLGGVGYWLLVGVLWSAALVVLWRAACVVTR